MMMVGQLGMAQFFEVGGAIGGSNYMGDLSLNTSKLYLKETNLAFGIYGRYNINYLLAVKLAANLGSISGSDANAEFEEIRSRNLSFQSSIVDAALTMELNVPGFQPYNLSRPISAYLFAGVGFSYTQPRAFYNGAWHALQPLGTEGQGAAGFGPIYSRGALAIPFGLGVKYAIRDKVGLGLELGVRRSFSDYLDDVSGNYADYDLILANNGDLAAALSNRTGEYLGINEPIILEPGTSRGDSFNADWYFLLQATVSYYFLDNGLVGNRKRNRRKQGCQTF